MSKHNNPSLVWDDDDYEIRKQKFPKKDKKEKKPGIAPEFDLSLWEIQKQKTNNRRQNKKKDKDKYDSKYDDWNQNIGGSTLTHTGRVLPFFPMENIVKG